jgi:hypothetical protein
MTGVPVGTPPVLGTPREPRNSATAHTGSSDTGSSDAGSSGLPRQRTVAEAADTSTGTTGSEPATAPFLPPSVSAGSAKPAGPDKPTGDPQVVSVAAFGARTSTAFDPQAPQPLPERIRPLVGALINTAGRVGLKLTLSCGRRVQVSCVGCGRLPAGALAGSGAAWSVVEAGLPTPGVLTVDDTVALALADVLLGGSGDVEPRAPERVESSVLRRHLGRALSPILEPLLPYGVRSLDLTDPPPDISPPELLGGAEMFAVRMSVELDSGLLPGVLVLALPYRTLFGTAGSADVPRDEKTNRALSSVPVDLTIRFPSTTVPAYDIAGLEPGDVLRLDVAQPLVQGLVDGVRLLSGSLGRSGRHRAILVSELESGLEAGT